ncbi:HGxxPAAW family protein [Marinactinospora thermotolerans]|uniref:HGxxPAAW family protein n=1 Tax=Marinactinospora thermotolerans TaxID=531310 RepID=UPI003D8ECBE8
MADEHHDDHGNTLSAWFLTLSWIVLWSVAAVFIVLGSSLITWTAIALVGSIVCAVIAGGMKKAGLGRKTPRPVPMTREEWERLQTPAEKVVEKAAEAVTGSGEGKETGKDDAPVAATSK